MVWVKLMKFTNDFYEQIMQPEYKRLLEDYYNKPINDIG